MTNPPEGGFAAGRGITLFKKITTTLLLAVFLSACGRGSGILPVSSETELSSSTAVQGIFDEKTETGGASEAPPEKILSVKDFGAKGDGVSDDYQPIMDALSAAPAAVFFPKGTYYISKTITMPKNNSGMIGEKAVLHLKEDITGIRAHEKESLFFKEIYIKKDWSDRPGQ